MKHPTFTNPWLKSPNLTILLLSGEADSMDCMKSNCKINRASVFFQDWCADVTHGAKNGGSFSEMMSPSISN